MWEWLLSNFNNVERIAVLISVASLTFGALTSFLARSASKTLSEVFAAIFSRPSPKRYRTQDSVATPSQVARQRALARIQEAREALHKQLSAEKWSRISGNLLTVGQYIIGGLLASSFVQESLSPKLVGFLGVLVLLASLLKQHFRPEVSAENASKKAVRLRALIRMSEDQITILDAKIASGQDHTDAMISLLTRITDRLTEIETPDAIERPELPEKPNQTTPAK
jgi:hypothetical protein